MNKRQAIVNVSAVGGVLFALFVGCLSYAYMNPHHFLTKSGKALRDKELVDAENAVRENVVYLAGAILVIGTLAASFKTLELERKKFASEKEKEELLNHLLSIYL